MSYQEEYTIGVFQIYEHCGYPQATPDEIANWNSLEGGADTAADVRLGLFGYDISCLASVCAQIDNLDGTGFDYTGYCTFI
jgi:hypothetical protein